MLLRLILRSSFFVFRFTYGGHDGCMGAVGGICQAEKAHMLLSAAVSAKSSTYAQIPHAAGWWDVMEPPRLRAMGFCSADHQTKLAC